MLKRKGRDQSGRYHFSSQNPEKSACEKGWHFGSIEVFEEHSVDFAFSRRRLAVDDDADDETGLREVGRLRSFDTWTTW
jgi:hypothetical protein